MLIAGLRSIARAGTIADVRFFRFPRSLFTNFNCRLLLEYSRDGIFSKMVRGRANRRLSQLNFALFTELANDQESVFSTGSAVSLLPSIVPAMNQVNEGKVAENKSKVEPEGSLGSNSVAAAAGSTNSSLPSSLSWVVHMTPDALALQDNDNDDWEMLGDDADSAISVKSNFVLTYADAVQFGARVTSSSTPKDAPATFKTDEEALSVRTMDTNAQIDTFIELEARSEPRGRKNGTRRDGKQRWKRY